ncbi:MAG: glycosyltransferase family 4 protein [Planctomycetota bacterium]|jgi:glycosyltransferase involved in cell wall biosynthesis
MRILMIAHSDAPWTPHFARYFTTRGDTLRIVSFAPYKIDGVDGIDMVFVGIEPFHKYKNKHMFFSRIPQVRRIIKNFQPDLVFATYLVSNGLMAACSWKGPLLVSAVGGDVLEQSNRKNLLRRLREMIIKFVCRRANIINPVSQAIYDELVRLGVPTAKLFKLPFGVDLNTFYPNPDMPRNQATEMICTRKHENLYDIPTIIDALVKLKSTGKKFHCTFTSEGTLLDQNKARAETAGLNDYVTFTGNLPHCELPGLLRKSDIYISSSLSDGTSVALLEAMASGLLPVVTRIPANTPWIEHQQTGLLFDAGRSDQLAQDLAQAMDDARLRQRVFEKNRQRVDRDTNLKRNMDRLYEIFEDLIARYRRK